MDSSLLVTDDRQTPAPLTDGQAEDADSILHRPALNKEPDELPGADGCFCRENRIDSEGLEPSWCSSSLSSGIPLCSETPAEIHDVKLDLCLGSSTPVLPPLLRLSQELFPTLPGTISEHHVDNEPPFPSPHMQGNSTPESSESLTDSFSFEHRQAASSLRPLSPRSESSEGATVGAASLSELYIFESDTKGFILSPVEIKCPEYPPLPPTHGTEVNHESDAPVLMCDSRDIVAGCHHSSSWERDTEINESGRMPPAADACEEPGNDAGQDVAEVAGLTSQPQRNDSPAELWLDACQYLEGEDADVLDKTGRSVMQRRFSGTSDSSSLPGETQVSDCNPDGSKAIGWPGDDTGGRGPRVERWSSVDSWASALSDWTGIIEAPPEGFTAAFAEIGAEIDALTQALSVVNTRADSGGRDPEAPEQARARPAMGVQDQALKEQNTPESSIHSSRSCLSLCLESPVPELRDRDGAQSVESLCDSAPEERDSEDSRSSPYATSQHSPMGSSGATVGSLGGYGGDVTLMPGSASFADLDVTQFDGYGKSLDSDIYISDVEPVVLNIREETDSDSSSEFVTEKTFKDGLCEVTDKSSSPQFDWTSGLTESDREEDEAADSPAVRCPKRSHVPGVNPQPGQHINVYARSQFDTSPDLDGARQVGPEWGSPKFIMPLAPLSPVSSLVCWTSSGLEADQTFAKRPLGDNRVLGCDHDVRQRVVLPASGGITERPSLESDEELIHKKEDTANAAERSSPEGPADAGDAVGCFAAAPNTKFGEINDFNGRFQNFTAVPETQIFVSKKSRVACITLNLHDPFASRTVTPISIAAQTETQPAAENMPHKTHRGPSEGKARSKKDKSAAHHHGAQAPKKQDATSGHHGLAQQACKKLESHPATGENHASDNAAAGLEAKEANLVIDAAEKVASKPHGKKKKKHGPAAAPGGGVVEPLAEVENGAKPKTAKGRIDMFEAKLGAKAQKDSEQTDDKKSQKAEVKTSQGEAKPAPHTGHKDHQANNFTGAPSDDVIKRRRLSEDKFGKIVSALESKFPNVSIKPKGEEHKADAGANRRKAYSEVVKQKIPPKEDLKVVQPIQAVSVSGDPQSLCLWCQFAAVFSDYTVTWSREGSVLAEIKRSAGDESRVSLTINNASHKDLGKYQCRLSGLHGSLTLDYVLTYEVLSEIVIPPSPKIISTVPVEQASEEEDVHLSKLMFNEDFLSEQFFGENRSISIITDKSHFGEGMHRRAFRTKLHGGQIPLLVPGHPCVLKVHNAISYGTKNNEELIQKNFTLAVEECHVQNTARQYIKAYTAAAQSIEAFGDVPEIIPIYLIHRPSNDIPYATLEEELIGDFVKYSVKDGKEINLMRRDSEAGQKCCAFQHWVYHNTEGNLLVTDMQGVGMRLTDVGIATCKKGYKGFKGNCATSFIDQFKALHQCNTYCELLGLNSLQPKPKKPASAPKPKTPAAPKKKTFGPTVKSKS